MRDTETLTANRKLILLATNATDDHVCKLSRRGSSGGFVRNVYQADGTTLIAAVGDNASADFIYEGAASAWFQA